ncbi:MAG: hypothetical protein HC834_06940 [Rhodospirillales bacterium]|nr:hypothetical protein [Rhodospirillales bacterium]
MLTNEIEGRLLLSRHPEQAMPLLERALQQAQAALPSDVTARNTAAAIQQELALREGAQGNWEAALTLVAKQWQRSPSARCTASVSVADQRTLVLVYGNEGSVQGAYRADRSMADISKEQFIPDALQDLLQSCPQVSVLAPPLLNPHPDLLRPSIRWSFVSEQHPDRKPGPVSAGSLLIDTVQRRTVHLIRADNGGKTPPLLVSSMLRGLEVTPIRVLAKLRVASRAFLFAQGVCHEGASALALTPDPAGEKLTAALVRQQTLAGRPVIFLSRVPVAQHLGDLEEPWSLPSAFIEAGASLVITASQGEDDQALLEAVGRIAKALDGGKTAAQAVAEERLRAVAQGIEDFGFTITE